MIVGPDARPAFVGVEEPVAEFDESVQVIDSADGLPRDDAPSTRSSE
jgi:hypothetical protein